MTHYVQYENLSSGVGQGFSAILQQLLLKAIFLARLFYGSLCLEICQEKQNLIIPPFILAPSAPININFKSISANDFIVTWERPLNPNGIIKQYEILYSFYDGANTVRQTVSIPGENMLEKKLDGLYSFVKYTVQIRAETVDFGPYNTSEETTLESSKYCFLDFLRDHTL